MTRLLALALALLAGCTSSGSDSSGTGSVSITGTVGGMPLALKNAVSQVTTGDGSTLLVWLSPLANACGASSVLTPGEPSLELALVKQGASGLVAATDVGVYTTEVGGAGPFAEIDVFDRDANCIATSSEGKGTGTVTLTRADTTFAGTFDFTTGHDHLTGSFDTESCAWTDATSCAGVAASNGR